MNIQFLDKERIFKIDTEHTSYVMAVMDDEKFLEHVYFGKRLGDSDLRYLLRYMENPFLPSSNNGERGKVLASMKHELPGELTGDHRDGAVTIRTQGGHTAVQPYYVSHCIFQGKERLEGLPATFGHEEDTMSLEITMEDPVLHVRFLLTYSVFADTDAVMRSMRVINDGQESVRLEKALSLSLDMDCADMNQKPFRLLTLDGMWVRERHMNFREIGYGFQGVCSNRGETSHHEQAFLGLVSPSATQHQGEVYGFHLIYSGNFRGQVERDSYETLRVTLGINPDRFAFTLQPGESFQAPEGVMVFSAEGLNGMSHTFHDLYRNHLIRGVWKDKKRPILINNWEATYFDFDETKLLDIARDAKKCGIEMLVMDDGWFGKRDLDVSGLGYYDAVKQGIAREAAFYLEDKKNDIVTFRKVEVLNRVTGKMDMVKAALWMQPSSGVNGYVFARETDDCMLTVRPVCVRGVDGSPITRAIIALNPNLPGAEDLTLLPLAEILEQWEQLEEEEEYRKSGGYRRDHSHARENIGYFARVPFSETSDPWYISKVGDLIDAPHLGSLIAYDVILSIIRNASAMAHRVDVLRFLEEEGGKVVPVRADASEQISFGDLYEWAGKATDPPEALPNQIHLLIRIKVDQAMLRRHNRLLAACCLNMVGKSDSVMSRNSILEMDYRTCLYTDQAITILVAADTENAALEELVGADILQSRLCLDLQNLLEQRQELRDIGSGLSEKIQTIGHDTTEIDRFNARIVRLSTRIERDELITDSLELMVYSFIRQRGAGRSKKTGRGIGPEARRQNPGRYRLGYGAGGILGMDRCLRFHREAFPGYG